MGTTKIEEDLVFYKSLYSSSTQRIDKLLSTIELLRIERDILLEVIRDYKTILTDSSKRG